MPQYAANAREQYKKDNDKNKFITNVWNGIIANSKGRDIAKKATIAFLVLTQKGGKDSWIDGKEILKCVGNYKWNKSYGLWPWLWLEGNGADIIQVLGQFPDTHYKVKDEFYETLAKVVMGWTSKTN